MKRWLAFLRNHRDVIAGVDFFTVPTATFQLLHVFFVVHHDRRRILQLAVTDHPHAEWVVQQLRKAFPCGLGIGFSLGLPDTWGSDVCS